MTYIANHFLLVKGELIEKGQTVKGIAPDEIQGLLEAGAISESQVFSKDKKVKSKKDEVVAPVVLPEVVETEEKEPEVTAKTYDSMTDEEIVEIFKKYNKKQLVEILEEHNIMDVSESMDKSELIAAFIETGTKLPE